MRAESQDPNHRMSQLPIESPPSVLVIDDEPSLLRYFEYNIRRMGYEPRTGASITELFRLIEKGPHAVILLDLMLPDGEALDHLPRLVKACPMTSVVIVTAHGTIPKAVDAIKAGALNFIQKPVSPEQLETALTHGVEVWRLKVENQRLRRRLEPIHEFQGLIGESEPMQHLYGLIESVAGSSAPTLITGESGSGKELVARAVHALSARSAGPFVAINCAAIPHELLESEIFGHERGAFPGAAETYQGCFERADAGSLFLDEICEMDMGLQAKLLRLIQDQAFSRVGGGKPLRVDVRIIASTNQEPLRMIEAGKFREDLYYRLNVLPIHLPPLRERREDIALIATRFLRRLAEASGKGFKSLDVEALRALEAQPWRGNIRELGNVIQQAVALHDGERITLEMLPESIRNRGGEPARERGNGGDADGEDDPEKLRPFWQVERDEIQRALRACRGNVQDVARRLEISAATLYRKIEKYGLVK